MVDGLQDASFGWAGGDSIKLGCSLLSSWLFGWLDGWVAELVVVWVGGVPILPYKHQLDPSLLPLLLLYFFLPSSLLFLDLFGPIGSHIKNSMNKSRTLL